MLIKVNRLQVVYMEDRTHDIISLLKILKEINNYSEDIAKRAYIPEKSTLTLMDEDINRMKQLSEQAEKLGVQAGIILEELDTAKYAIDENDAELAKLALNGVHQDMVQFIDNIADRIIDMLQ